jgi:hypothetical protein
VFLSASVQHLGCSLTMVSVYFRFGLSGRQSSTYDIWTHSVPIFMVTEYELLPFKTCPMQTASGNYRTTESHHRIITTIHHPPKTAQTQNCQTHTFSRFRTAARSDERCWLQEFAPWCLNSRQVCNLHNALRLRF